MLLGLLAGVRSLDDLAEVAGMSRSATFAALRRLRRDGMVSWDTGRRGTLRPLVEVVEIVGASDDEAVAS